MSPRPFLMILLGTGAILGWTWQLQIRNLSQQNAVLRQAAQEKRLLSDQLAALPHSEVDWDELTRLRRSRQELFRLRGEIGLLRQAGRLTPQATKESLQQLLADTAEAKARIEALRAAERSRKTAEAAYNALKGLLGVFQEVTAFNQGRQPATMEELKAGADVLYGPGAHWPLGHPNRILGNVEEFFEFVPAVPGASHSRPVLLLREKMPRPLPDGGWVRLYAFSNSVSEVVLPENCFDAWERDPLRSLHLHQ